MNKKSFHDIVLVLSPIVLFDHEYITNLLKPKLERQTKSNSVNSTVDLSQVMLTVSVSQIMELTNSCTAKYNLRLLL